jgi:hypothetical protein
MADNISVKDAASATVVMRAKDNTSVFMPLHGLADTTGANVATVDSGGALLVSSVLKITSVTLTVDTGAHADGDVLADSQIVSACLRANDGTGTIINVTAIDEGDQGFGFDLFFLDANSSIGTENAAPSITDDNSRNILGWLRIAAADWIDLGGTRIASVPCSIPVKGVTGADDIYVAAVTRGAGTWAADDITLRIAIACD